MRKECDRVSRCVTVQVIDAFRVAWEVEMIRLQRVRWYAAFAGALFVGAGNTHARDIGGTISTTLTITEDSQLVDDVTCTVIDVPCIAIGAPRVTLTLNGFTMTGPADPQTACSGGTSVFPTGDGINVTGQAHVAILGPGLIQRFRGPGIFIRGGSDAATVRGVTVSTNCASGILVGGGSGHDIAENISVRNGHGAFACGGICLFGGVRRSRVRANRLSGNGYSAQENNFGIGMAGTSDNVVEENTAVGNTNGIFLTADVQGTIIRRNLFAGNPPVQVNLDHTAGSGYDIKNLSPPGVNTFSGNVCLTSINAPCAFVAPSLTASPNPIPVAGNGLVGSTTLSWNAPDVQLIEIHVSSPDGPLFASAGYRGSIQTGNWVSEGLTFYLQDVTGGKPLTADYTLASLVVHLQKK